MTSVSGDTGGPGCTLRDAIAAAETDTATGGCEAGIGADVIVLPPGVITLDEVHADHDGPTGLPSITTVVEVRSAGTVAPAGGGDDEPARATTVARAADAPPFRLFHVGETGDLTLSGVTVSGGYLEDGSSGAGMYVAGTATLTDVLFTANETQNAHGGALAAVGATLDLEEVDFTDNVVGPDDGGFTSAAVYLEGSKLDHWGGTLTGNRGSWDGGSAVVHVDAGSAANLNVDIVENEAAGIWNRGSLYLFVTLIEASANHLEGGLVNEGVANVEDSDIRRNRAQRVGGVYNTGTLDTYNVFIEDNEVLADEPGLAGGVANVGGTLALGEAGVWGNRAAGLGSAGGVFNSGYMILGNSGILRNESPAGAGIYLSAVDGPASLIIHTSVGASIRENRATGDGGGIYVDGPGLIVFEDAPGNESEIRDNVADADGNGVGRGGGLFHSGLAEGSVIQVDAIFDNVPDDIYGQP